MFDSFYTKLKTLKKEETFCNYNQIYLDFELMAEDDTTNEKINNHIILVVPICLENDDIKDREDEDLIFMD